MQQLVCTTPAASTAEVLAAARSFARRAATSAEQRQLFETALCQGNVWADNPGWTFFIHLPLFVYSAIRGDERPAIALATALTLLYVGMDVLDDLADGDRPEHWRGYRPAEINLAAVTFMAVLAPLALLEIDAPATRLATLQRTMAQMGLQMSAGQQADIGQAGAAQVTGATAALAAAGKTGVQCALFARLAAELAGAPVGRVAAYCAMAHHYDMALQVTEDCANLFDGPHSRDLAAGIRTYPIARYLEVLSGAARRASVSSRCWRRRGQA